MIVVALVVLFIVRTVARDPASSGRFGRAR
jgi:hypothetical protein